MRDKGLLKVKKSHKLSRFACGGCPEGRPLGKASCSDSGSKPVFCSLDQHPSLPPSLQGGQERERRGKEGGRAVEASPSSTS